MRRILLGVVVGLVVAPAQVSADGASLNEAVWAHLEAHGKVPIATFCEDGPTIETYCKARFNSRHQGCRLTFGENPFRTTSRRICTNHKFGTAKVEVLFLEDFRVKRPQVELKAVR